MIFFLKVILEKMRNFLELSLLFQTLLFRNYYQLFFLSMQFSIFHFCFLLLSQSLLHCSIFFNFSFFLRTYLATSSSCLSSFSDPFLLQIIPSGFEDSTRIKLFLPFYLFFFCSSIKESFRLNYIRKYTLN